MVTCPFCATNYVDNTLFCTECGHYLGEEDNDKGTDPLEGEESDDGLLITTEFPELEPVPPKSGPDPRAIRLIIGERERQVEVPLNRVIHLGRVDPGGDVFPEVDLSDHNPGRSISRRHANIKMRDGKVVVEDMHSINGTFLNGRKLDAYIPEILQTGDTLVLGKLRIEVEILTE
ncbi:MAG: FHA domain-containing protein [Anaerolineae bacterium]|nr:FHA domain-containing protein [Anaerolineae bacterium]